MPPLDAHKITPNSMACSGVRHALFGIPQCKQTLIEPTGTLLELLTTTAMSVLLIVLAQTRSRALVLEDVFERNFKVRT